MLSDYGLLVVLAVEDESCGLGGQKGCKIRRVTAVKMRFGEGGQKKLEGMKNRCRYRFLVVEPLDPADRDRLSSANLLATSLSHSSSELTTDSKGGCWS